MDCKKKILIGASFCLASNAASAGIDYWLQHNFKGVFFCAVIYVAGAIGFFKF